MCFVAKRDDKMTDNCVCVCLYVGETIDILITINECLCARVCVLYFCLCADECDCVRQTIENRTFITQYWRKELEICNVFKAAGNNF